MGSILSGLFQQVLDSKNLQNGNPGDNKNKAREWVASLDFSDAYFYIPIGQRSRKFLRLHFRNQSYQFKALPFGLSTAPVEFTCVVKEVKLMAKARGLRFRQYLDDWLIRVQTNESCHQDPKSLMVPTKLELEPKTDF